MDEKKITFIICVNDLWYYEECVRYIKELYVPDGHSIDILCIQEADSMAQGYMEDVKLRMRNIKYICTRIRLLQIATLFMIFFIFLRTARSV